jgi:hypothetical protein
MSGAVLHSRNCGRGLGPLPVDLNAPASHCQVDPLTSAGADVPLCATRNWVPFPGSASRLFEICGS